MCYSLWYNALTMLPASGRQHRRCIIPQNSYSTTVVISERRLGNDDLLVIQGENWTLCAELQRSSC